MEIHSGKAQNKFRQKLSHQTFFLKGLGTITAQIGIQNLITLYHLNRNFNVCSIDMLKFHSIKNLHIKKMLKQEFKQQ